MRSLGWGRNAGGSRQSRDKRLSSGVPRRVPLGFGVGASLGLMLLFVVLSSAAALVYPGGSYVDARAPGYDFWHNFWCDVTRERALNGTPNPLGAILSRAGLGAMAAALGPFWWVSRERFGRRALGRAVGLMGGLSALGLSLVAILPSDRFPAAHPVLTLSAGGLGFLAATILVGRALGVRSRVEAGLGIATLLAASLNIVLYVQAAFLEAPLDPRLPGIQKIATLLLLAWMVSALLSARREA